VLLLAVWCGLAIQPLAWELPYASGAALKRQRRKKKKNTASKMSSVGWVGFRLVKNKKP